MDAIILELVGLNSTSENVKIHDTPACSNKLLEMAHMANSEHKSGIIGTLLVV